MVLDQEMKALLRCSLPAFLTLLLTLGPATAAAETAAEKVYKITLPSVSSEPAPANEGQPRPKPSREPRPSGEEPPAATPAPEPTPDPQVEPATKSRPDPRTGRPRDQNEPHAISPAVVAGTPIAAHDETPTPAKTATSKKSSGGSSPVVALLIAISVLAVISIGVARHRMRG
jgi:hypothetical protein